MDKEYDYTIHKEKDENEYRVSRYDYIANTFKDFVASRASVIRLVNTAIKHGYQYRPFHNIAVDAFVVDFIHI